MKIKICRSSGHPIDYTDQAAFSEDYRLLYDKVTIKLNMDGASLITPEKAERATRLLDRASRSLRAKYPLIGEIELPKTGKAWLALIVQHGPIALAKNAATGEVTAVIMDSDWQQ